jgi:hypothetical protein
MGQGIMAVFPLSDTEYPSGSLVRVKKKPPVRAGIFFMKDGNIRLLQH